MEWLHKAFDSIPTAESFQARRFHAGGLVDAEPDSEGSFGVLPTASTAGSAEPELDTSWPRWFSALKETTARWQRAWQEATEKLHGLGYRIVMDDDGWWRVLRPTITSELPHPAKVGQFAAGSVLQFARETRKAPDPSTYNLVPEVEWREYAQRHASFTDAAAWAKEAAAIGDMTMELDERGNLRGCTELGGLDTILARIQAAKAASDEREGQLRGYLEGAEF